MAWRWCLLLLALSGAAFSQVQPPRMLQISIVTKRSVSYTFAASPTSGATYKVTFMHQRVGIPIPGARTFNRPGFGTASGLIPDVTYTLRVVAVLSGAESTPVRVNFTTTPDVPSGPPLNFVVSARNTTSITLTWSDPAPDKINDRDGVTEFVVKKSGVQVTTVKNRTITFTGLTPASSYDFEVLAINHQGTAPANHAARLRATTASGVPSSPTLRVVLPRFSNTFLVWSDPEPFVGPITGFQIRYLIDGVAQNIPELDGDVHTHSVRGIKSTVGKTHSVSIRAKTAAGYGDYSETVVFTFRPIVEAVIMAADCDTVKVSYTVNPLPGGDKNKASLQSFVVEYRPILGGSDSGTRSVPLNGNPAEGVLCLSGLRANTPYRVTYNVEVNPGVQIVLPLDLPETKQLFTLRSCARHAQCTESIIAPPNPPPLRVVLPRFSNTYLEWSDPEPFLGPITGFQIRYLIGGVVHDMPELDGGVHAYSVSGVEGSEGKTHSVSLRAKTAAGYGGYSDPMEFIFQPIVDIDTAVDCNTLQINYTVNPLPGEDSNEASLQSLVVKYQRTLGGGDSETRSVPLNGNPAEGVLCLAGLTADTAYRITYSVNVNTSSSNVVPPDIANPAEILTEDCDQPGQCIETNSNVPDGPARQVRVDKIDSYTLEVSWMNPEPRHTKPGFDITRYLVIVGTSCGEGAKMTVLATQLQWHSVRFTGLEPGTTYCARVVPGNIAGFALPQSVQSSDEMEELPQIMSAPFIVGVTPHEHHAIVIWEKVESGDEDNPVTDYIIQIETYVDGEHMVYRRMFSSFEVLYHFNMTQLAAGRLYAVSVAAQNGLGMGRIGSTTFRTLVLMCTDGLPSKEMNSSILPEGHDETAPDLGKHEFSPGEEFTVAACMVTPRPPTPPPPDSSPIGPLLKLYQEAKCNNVIRKPLFRVPVPVEMNGEIVPQKMFLCYDVRGWANQAFNLISDTCVSVNALYSPRHNTSDVIITKIGVLAKDNGQCVEIAVDLMDGCAVTVNGKDVKSKYTTDGGGMLVYRLGDSRVRIVVPNCNKSAALAMWVHCRNKKGRPMMPFDITQRTSVGSTSHGLVGQFWNANVEATGYNVTAADHIAPDPNHYAVTVTSRSGNTRRFFASRILRRWDKHSNVCMYAGGTQGGRVYEVPSLPGSVIEGSYDEYAVSGLFDPDYKYSQFTSQCS